MKQLAGGKHMENDCFPRTLKFEMLSRNLNIGETQRTGLRRVEEPAGNYEKKDVMTDEVMQC
jgi:hypothetical protein